VCSLAGNMRIWQVVIGCDTSKVINFLARQIAKIAIQTSQNLAWNRYTGWLFSVFSRAENLQ